MAALTVQDARNGLANVTFVACNAGGDTVVAGTGAGGWSLPVTLLVKNTDAATRTITVQGTATISPATTGLSWINVEQIYAGQPVAITYSAVTNLTIAAVSKSGIG